MPGEFRARYGGICSRCGRSFRAGSYISRDESTGYTCCRSVVAPNKTQMQWEAEQLESDLRNNL